MDIRKTEERDIEKVLSIYEQARKFMAEAGNPGQWTGGYPAEEDLRRDMERGGSYVCLENGEIAATFFFLVAEEPTYRVIREGKWLNEEPYGVVHRVASASRGRGLASYCLSWCLEQCHNVRIDTHRDNIPMQNMLGKLGFVRCGIVYMEDGSERIAFQRCDE
ncbi:MAG TPA: GNAT family N-acetyltransferase [Candidatus Lachnoclostridium stercoripullorum]|uniref:GNAT family N-acetyltransferase n=1 Tax=Candidatus Lachnoclostridium stercoripullorum TaxID=2838635 RepID=A0A9D1W4B3_9FIRM|nr:GNAT family N-acetyltransferase [Candidatus Lachnoclostridium stercoripullorum]